MSQKARVVVESFGQKSLQVPVWVVQQASRFGRFVIRPWSLWSSFQRAPEGVFEEELRPSCPQKDLRDQLSPETVMQGGMKLAPRGWVPSCLKSAPESSVLAHRVVFPASEHLTSACSVEEIVARRGGRSWDAEAGNVRRGT